MGSIRPPRLVLRIVAAFSRHAEALAWGRTRAESVWGPVALESERFAFVESDYYEPQMGAGLLKTFWAFRQLADPGQLPDWKCRTNAWEEELAATHRFAESRPLNLDPGYLTEAKLVLASTKDRDHRIYLDRGIFAEVTLYYHRGQWCTRPWTYPDYGRGDYHQFFERCRNYLRQAYRSSPA